ncbi:MAG: SAM-dependent methyltransferase [Cyanophyceae cyanobacterium]
MDSLASPPPYHPDLLRTIAGVIAASTDQRITFADYMAIALYDPAAGYYATRAARGIGPGGDFVTSPHMGPDFGELIAEQLVDFWQRLGRPDPFDLVEMGAGQGLLAADILAHLRDRHPVCYGTVRYSIIEKAAAAIAAQRQRLLPWGEKITWTTWDDIPTKSIRGCCFSNELVDAFPVHRLQWDGDQWQEIYVTLAPAGSPTPLSEVLGPPSRDRLVTYFDLVGIDVTKLPKGYVTEVNLTALDWLEVVGDRLDRGYLLTVDYGYDAGRYYQPAREGGTLRCYSRHAHHGDPYAYIGYQDITAHVDFTALERWGDRAGLRPLGRTPQALFLMALGLGDRLNALAHSPDPLNRDLNTLLRRRDTLHRLIDPLGLGNFQVLIQTTEAPDRDRADLDTPRGLREPHFQ